ncbi:MAG: glycosyltransferase family 4 protein [Cyclobacteriaceae bacterium]
MDIIFFIDNNLGGVTSLNYNLASHKTIQKVNRYLINIDYFESNFSRANLNFPVDKQIEFKFSDRDNYYYTLKRLRSLIPYSEGALILNYYNEMALLDHYNLKQTTFQLVHDDYNITLSKKYEYLVDVFICHNTVIYNNLISLFPHRRESIFFLPHGVPIVHYSRMPKDNGPLRLVFLGRMTSGKGIFDLPVINDLLRERGVDFEWLCIGNGPDLEAFKQAWSPADKVQFISPSSNREVLELCSQRDVFVLPTKGEGSPVSLLETMSVGLVPVISRIPGGITDIVNDEIGFTPEINDNIAFADSIARLHFDRDILNSLSNNCRSKIISQFDVRKTASDYFDLFLRYKEFYRDKKIRKAKVGSRLDQPFIPNKLTKLIRTFFKAK